MMSEEFQVEQDGARLDRVVARGAGLSRRLARLAIAAGRVSVNGKIMKILGRPLKAGARVQLRGESPQGAASPNLTILFEDAHMIVVNKPARLLAAPDRVGAPNVQDEVAKTHGTTHLVHRLDAGTSGVMVLARTAKQADRWQDAFRKRQVRKRYLAIVSGELSEPVQYSEPLGRLDARRQGVVPDGKEAFTQITPLSIGSEATLVEARPTTGRTHQIRVHLAHHGHPICGDRLYGGPGYTEQRVAIARPMLHAARIELGEDAWDCPPPADFRECLATYALTL